MGADVRWQAEHMDWQPLEAVVGTFGCGDWIWMHASPSAETGEIVHFYKHRSSRRYLRLDAAGRLYGEARDGEPVALPGCGGASLVLQLVAACATFDGLPPVITLPETAREGTRADDAAVLQALVQLVDEEVRSLRRVFAASPVTAAAYGRTATSDGADPAAGPAPPA